MLLLKMRSPRRRENTQEQIEVEMGVPGNNNNNHHNKSNKGNCPIPKLLWLGILILLYINIHGVISSTLGLTRKGML
ncbi:hypothetical protein A2U01_0084030 [Trifolium medium]|uniref:Uncharacterized protein n=1 Tax=Trifolium medium TaxID=97028 RepID=A0A392TNQ4_9FABA|nr:hypothetical protein [Trifolium medium]